jgi:putative membrane protein
MTSPGSPWAFHVDADVVALIVVLATTYWWALRNVGPRLAPRSNRPASRTQTVSFGLGLASIWLGSGWPLHELADRWLYSAHALQHMLYGLVSAPLLLAGTPGWMLRALLGRGVLLRVARGVTRPLVAFVVFNGTMVLMHWPAVVQAMVDTPALHAALHGVTLGAGIVMWMPLLSPLPELPRLTPPANLLYLFLQSILPTVPASFLTFGETVLYPHYDVLPRLWGISAIADQQVAGLLMKVGAGFLLWGMIAVLFFAWQAEEDASGRGRDLDFDELELELTRMGTSG